MSSKSIALYQNLLASTGRAPRKAIDVTGCAPKRESSRLARTLPPPAMASDLTSKAAALRAEAARLIAQAEDLEAAAKVAL
jgi:hypothetical protein